MLGLDVWPYVWRCSVLAGAAGLGAAGLTALFLAAGVPSGAAPVLAMGTVMPPVLVISARWGRRSGGR